MTDKERTYTFLKDLRNTTFLISDTEAIPLVLNFIKAIREVEDIIESAFQFGKEAAEANESFETCPYNAETPAHIWWQRGFSYTTRLQRAHAAEQKLATTYDMQLKQANTIEQTLGQALGYPWYKDDQENFPNATEADGVCTGEHTPESIAMEAANKIRDLENKITNIQQHTSDPLCESQDVDLTHHTSDSPPWTASNIDYRSLFIKYLSYITDEEGTNLIEYTPGFASNVKFTATEWAELRKLDKESQELPLTN